MVKQPFLIPFRNYVLVTGEAGGITQHIGAYQIEEGGKKITFWYSRTRGLYIYACPWCFCYRYYYLDSQQRMTVLCQTIEAINHSKAAGVPIIAAINKIDKPGATQSVIGELAEHGVISTAWGGDSEFVEIPQRSLVKYWRIAWNSSSCGWSGRT